MYLCNDECGHWLSRSPFPRSNFVSFVGGWGVGSLPFTGGHSADHMAACLPPSEAEPHPPLAVLRRAVQSWRWPLVPEGQTRVYSAVWRAQAVLQWETPVPCSQGRVVGKERQAQVCTSPSSPVGTARVTSGSCVPVVCLKPPVGFLAAQDSSRVLPLTHSRLIKRWFSELLLRARHAAIASPTLARSILVSSCNTRKLRDTEPLLERSSRKQLPPARV